MNVTFSQVGNKHSTIDAVLGNSRGKLVGMITGWVGVFSVPTIDNHLKVWVIFV